MHLPIARNVFNYEGYVKRTGKSAFIIL